MQYHFSGSVQKFMGKRKTLAFNVIDHTSHKTNKYKKQYKLKNIQKKCTSNENAFILPWIKSTRFSRMNAI